MEVYQLPTALERNITLPIGVFLQMWSPDQAPASAENVLETQILRPTPNQLNQNLGGGGPAIWLTSFPGDPDTP